MHWTPSGRGVGIESEGQRRRREHTPTQPCSTAMAAVTSSSDTAALFADLNDSDATS
jgi:hypothetical protein